jgi:integrase
MLTLYTKEKNNLGKWRTKKVNEGRGVKTSAIPGPFYVRPTSGGKQIERRLHALTFLEARDEALHVEEGLRAESKGLTVAELDGETNAHRLPVKTVVESYLQLKSNKSKKTQQQYRLALYEFLESLAECKVRFLDAITVETLRYYLRFLTAKGYAAKTIDTRINVAYFMLKKNGVEARIPRDELPAVETEAAVPYSDEDLSKMFAVMTKEEDARYRFFLGTACRSAEVTFASWSDIDFDRGTYTIRSKPEAGFTVKNHESRTVPLPDNLVAVLKARRMEMPDSRWIFGDANGLPGNHFLLKLKRIAKRAGINCGQCRKTVSRWTRGKKVMVQVSCQKGPHCAHIYLHRFRKTTANRWSEKGIPIRTIQHYLGHKSLEVTARYLGISDSDALRGKINDAFAI